MYGLGVVVRLVSGEIGETLGPTDMKLDFRVTVSSYKCPGVSYKESSKAPNLTVYPN